MKLKDIIVFLLFLFATFPCAGKNSNNVLRQYHDSYIGTAQCDTVVTLCPQTKNVTSKAIEIRATSAVKNRANASTAYGIAWGINPNGAMYQATLNITEQNDFDDVAYTPTAVLTITQIDSLGKTQIIDTKNLTKDIDTEQCHNTMSVEINCQSGIVDILVGENNPQIVANHRISLAEAQLGLGIVAIGKPTFDVIVSEEVRNKAAKLETSWTITKIDDYLSQLSENSGIEGYWQYLDRDNDPQYCRLGGKYRLAITANNEGGYDLIYISGADISATEWKPGMLKGHLVPTKFKNHFNLIWFDSIFDSQSNECSASIEQDAIIRFDFPLLKSSIRFSKE